MGTVQFIISIDESKIYDANVSWIYCQIFNILMNVMSDNVSQRVVSDNVSEGIESIHDKEQNGHMFLPDDLLQL